MTSLTDVYQGRVRWVASPRRLYLGVATFLAGAVMVVAGIVVATTHLATGAGVGLFAARELGGTLAGLGVPLAFGGVFVALPTSRRTRATVIIGGSVAVLGVALFRHAYPYQWLGSGHAGLALTSTGVYSFGALTTFVGLFVAVATLKTRSAPGGTATVEVTEEGRIRIVEEERTWPSMGSIGLFGSGPDGTVETQTNDDRAGGHATATPSATVSDGGSAAVVDSSTAASSSSANATPESDAEFLDAAETRGRPDAYCGNCQHFEYVRSDDRMVPYCGLHADLMEDMDACEQWTAND
ncbi:MAG: hypothetical protein ABEI96_05330 [Haloarculaceae archaeon]